MKKYIEFDRGDKGTLLLNVSRIQVIKHSGEHLEIHMNIPGMVYTWEGPSAIEAYNKVKTTLEIIR